MMDVPENKQNEAPNGLTWAVAAIGLLLPWVAIPLGIFGVITGLRGDLLGWWLLSVAFALLLLDLAIDLFWSRFAAARTDEPDLNLRGSALVGRTAIVTESINAGRGKVRIDDTVWIAQGPDLAAGASVEIVAAESVVLSVTPSDRGSARV